MNNTLVTAEVFRQWGSLGVQLAILAALLKVGSPLARTLTDYLVKMADIRRQEKRDNREGYGILVSTLNQQVLTLTQRVEQLSAWREKDHKLIISLLGQLNRSQAAAILSATDPESLSPEISSMLEGTATDPARTGGPVLPKREST